MVNLDAHVLSFQYLTAFPMIATSWEVLVAIVSLPQFVTTQDCLVRASRKIAARPNAVKDKV